MSKLNKILLYASAAIVLSFLSVYTSGSFFYSLASLVSALFLYAYNAISKMDTIPDSDYLVTGEGPFAAAGICIIFLTTSSIYAGAGGAAIFCVIYLLFFKYIISPVKRESLYAGLLLSAALWLPLAVYYPDTVTIILSLTGFAAAGLLDIYSLIFPAAAALALIIVPVFFREELRVINHGNEELLLSRRKKTVIKAASTLARPLAAAGIVFSGGLMLSFGYFIRRFRPYDTGIMIFILFFCLAQIFFIAASIVENLMCILIFIIISAIIAYLTADKKWFFLKTPHSGPAGTDED